MLRWCLVMAILLYPSRFPWQSTETFRLPWYRDRFKCLESAMKPVKLLNSCGCYLDVVVVVKFLKMFKIEILNNIEIHHMTSKISQGCMYKQNNIGSKVLELKNSQTDPSSSSTKSELSHEPINSTCTFLYNLPSYKIRQAHFKLDNTILYQIQHVVAL